MIEGSREYSAISLSAGGQDEQPWLVKSSITARGSARAGCATRTASHESASEDANWRRTIAISCPRAPQKITSVSLSYRGSKSHATHFTVSDGRRRAVNLGIYAARWRRTYCRMPPFLKYSSSS